MNQKQTGCAASLLLSTSLLLGAPGCAPSDADLPEQADADHAADEHVGSRSDALLSKWQSACLMSALTDYVWCYNDVRDVCNFGANLPFSGPTGMTDADCRAAAEKQCKPGYDNATRACAAGITTVYRVFSRSFFARHIETKVPGYGTIEASYKFATSPVAGADSRPLRRCQASAGMDFLTNSSDCEGGTSISGIVGYSFAPSTPGARAVYRCRAGDDHFISYSSNCEGETGEGLLGYAK